MTTELSTSSNSISSFDGNTIVEKTVTQSRLDDEVASAFSSVKVREQVTSSTVTITPSPRTESSSAREQCTRPSQAFRPPSPTNVIQLLDRMGGGPSLVPAVQHPTPTHDAASTPRARRLGAMRESDAQMCEQVVPYFWRNLAV